MALRFMGKEKVIDEKQVIVFPTTFQVGAYFKPYIALAFKLGLMNEAEEFKAAEAAKGQDWGSGAASREWMTKLIVRAAGKGDVAKDLASKSPAFQDVSSISSGYAGYVNAAVSLGLVTGVTPQRFEPLTAVNRASAAVLFSRAQQLAPVAYGGETVGILTAVSSGTITIYTDKGIQTFNLASDSRFYRFDSESSLKSFGDLQLYTHVRVLGGGTDALYVEQTDPDEQVKVIEGSISKLVPAQNKLWLWVGDEPKEFIYDSSLNVKKSDGTKLSLSDLTVDSQVSIKQDAFRDKPLALRLRSNQRPLTRMEPAP